MYYCINCNKIVKRYDYYTAKIYVCKNCGLGRAIRKDNYQTYEIELSEKKLSDNYYMDRRSFGNTNNYKPFKDFFSFIKNRFNKKDIKLLDIGCGNGIFLETCIDKGFDVTGIEGNKNIENIVSDKLKKKIYFSSVEKMTELDQKYDIITFWDSFEHIENAFDILEKLKVNLEDEGIIYIRVNNNRDVFNWVTMVMLSIFPPVGKILLAKCFHIPYHVWNFSLRSMKEMLGKGDWKIIKYEFGETPANRLTTNKIFFFIIQLLYLFNRCIKGGKIANYYITRV